MTASIKHASTSSVAPSTLTTEAGVRRVMVANARRCVKKNAPEEVGLVVRRDCYILPLEKWQGSFLTLLQS